MMKRILATTSQLFGRLSIKLRSFFDGQKLARIGKNVSIYDHVQLIHGYNIEIGNKVRLKSRVIINPHPKGKILLEDQVFLQEGVSLLGGSGQTKIHLKERVRLDQGVHVRTSESGEIEIGESTYVGPYTCIAGPGSVKIGKDCLIASHTGIYGNNHNFSDPTLIIREQGLTCKGIVIGDDCWLGTGVKVLDGVTIGRGSVIGSGAVVTKDIPPYSVAVGVPAKVIKQRDKVEQEEKLGTVSSV